MIDEAALKLGEHCDSVRVLCTFPTEGGVTRSYTVGNGNIHAQIGLVKDWVIRQDEYTRTNARNEQNNEDGK